MFTAIICLAETTTFLKRIYINKNVVDFNNVNFIKVIIIFLYYF